MVKQNIIKPEFEGQQVPIIDPENLKLFGQVKLLQKKVKYLNGMVAAVVQEHGGKLVISHESIVKLGNRNLVCSGDKETKDWILTLEEDETETAP